jgi:hypothetical protein
MEPGLLLGVELGKELRDGSAVGSIDGNALADGPSLGTPLGLEDAEGVVLGAYEGCVRTKICCWVALGTDDGISEG